MSRGWRCPWTAALADRCCSWKVREMELEDLRTKYSGATGGAIHDPALKAVADGLFTGDRRRWPFEGVRTFLDAPYVEDAAKALFSGQTISGIDVALVGVPMDLGVTNRAGSRLGPKAVRQVEIGCSRRPRQPC